ncbi:hypothetical protein [Dickeya chrysanthemi]|uniref:hypothetical protein n=1 Tax=Dickeya chrysanthemi TaxID=556 RepID=UPI000532D4D1|nr:hypothetical protein [Dickeya chrysanthemi]
MNKQRPLSMLAAQSAGSHVDLWPEGIRITHESAAVQDETRLLTFDEAVSRLDSTEYDRALLTGIQVVRALTDAMLQGHFMPDDRQKLILFRWFVSVKFVLEQEEINGCVTVTDDSGHPIPAALYRSQYGELPVFPAAERATLAGAVEGAMTATYGEEDGRRNALALYVAMVGPVAGELTETGRSVMATLHDQALQLFALDSVLPSPATH